MEVKYYMNKGIPVAKVVITKSAKGFPIMGILTIIFVIAKLFDKLDWSWFMVFWPLWIVPAIFLGIFAVIIGVVILMLAGAIILDLIADIKRSLKRRKLKGRNL